MECYSNHVKNVFYIYRCKLFLQHQGPIKLNMMHSAIHFLVSSQGAIEYIFIPIIDIQNSFTVAVLL